MIIGFDWDGTLVESWTWGPLPGVRERLAQLPLGCKSFIATNQAGPVFRAVLGQTKYPTAGDVAARIALGLAALDWFPDVLYVACHPGKDGGRWDDEAAEHELPDLRKGKIDGAYPDLTRAINEAIRLPLGVPFIVLSPKHFRKPQPGMLLQAAQDLDAPIADMVYVGDMQADQEAAAAAGCRFISASVWRASSLL